MIRALRLLSQQMLGINRRNQELLARYNPRSLFPLVDHKVKTKEALSAIGAPVANTLAVYRSPYDLRRFADESRAWPEFVVKPAQGAGGEGIVVVTERRDRWFMTSNGQRVAARQLESHLSDILGGVYSLNQRYDEVLIEQRLHGHPALARLSFRGLPDIRILVFCGVPLLAMVRLATQASKGRANLHVGGIGVGIDLLRGKTTAAVLGKRWIEVHPDTDRPLLDIQIPRWDEVLLTAARCADAVAIGYLGVDLVLDADRGPVVLELNARPGLSIQLANRHGLRPLLARVEQYVSPALSARDRVELGQRIFVESRSQE
jgi:alpha-L-glutamate ligase-like protein